MDTRETYIVVDELDAHLETGPLAWCELSLQHFSHLPDKHPSLAIQPLDNDYGPTHSFPMFSVDISDPSTAGPPAWVAFQFDGECPLLRLRCIAHYLSGTSINLRGTTSEAPQDFLVSIDGATPYNTSTGDRTPQTYLEWFQSPMHPQGNHKMNISNIRGTAIDVLLITPGPDTALLGKTLLVDDISPDIKFLGRGWKTSARPFKRRTNTSKKVTQPAIQNGTHETSTIGDGLFFAFTGAFCSLVSFYATTPVAGTRARLYGIVPSSPGGSYMLTTSVDNGPPKLENLTYTRPNTNSNGDSPNDRCYHLLADTGDLAEGSHGFEVRLNETKDAPFIVDYILYDPTFSTLATKPDLSAMEPSPPSSETQPPSPSATSIDPGPLRSKVNIGAVVGGVVGIVTFAVVTSLIFLLLWRKRNRRRRGNKLKDEDSLFQRKHNSSNALFPSISHLKPSLRSSFNQTIHHHHRSSSA